MSQKEALDLAHARFIDAHLDLYGYIDAKTLCEKFSVCRTKASRCISRYRKAYPSNSRFNVDKGQHERTFTFAKAFPEESSLTILSAADTLYQAPLKVRKSDNDDPLFKKA